MERPKDPMTKFRSVIRGKNSKGGDRIQLYLGGDQNTGNAEIEQLIVQLTASLENPKGVKLDLHISRKTAEASGREFDSAIAFVKPVSEGGIGGRPSAPTGGKTFAPKVSAAQVVAKARIT